LYYKYKGRAIEMESRREQYQMLKEEEFEEWRQNHCPQVIGGSGIGDCNCCPYPVCRDEFFKNKEVENETANKRD